MFKRNMVRVGFIILGVLGLVAGAFAAGNGLDDIASHVAETFGTVAQLMIGGAYVSGFGLTIAAIFKFKQHKDNPQSVQMGTPIVMLLVGVALIFLPSIIKPAGTSIFGVNAVSGGFAGEGVNNLGISSNT